MQNWFYLFFTMGMKFVSRVKGINTQNSAQALLFVCRGLVSQACNFANYFSK
jgi:hypothetical protein